MEHRPERAEHHEHGVHGPFFGTRPPYKTASAGCSTGRRGSRRSSARRCPRHSAMMPTESLPCASRGSCGRVIRVSRGLPRWTTGTHSGRSGGLSRNASGFPGVGYRGNFPAVTRPVAPKAGGPFLFVAVSMLMTCFRELPLGMVAPHWLSTAAGRGRVRAASACGRAFSLVRG